LTGNTLFGLIKTNKFINDPSKPLIAGFAFRAIGNDLSDFILSSDNATSTILLHDNDYLLLNKDVEHLSNVSIRDIDLVKDYDLSVFNLQNQIVANDGDIAFLSTSTDYLSSALSNYVFVKTLDKDTPEEERTIEYIASQIKDKWNVNDIIIVRTPITDILSHYEHTAYVFDGTVWKAMDGNYSADNVIMPENLTFTYQFGKYTVPAAGSYDLTCKGMTVKEFMLDAYSQILHTTKKDPTISQNTQGFTGEIGTTYNLAAATITFNDGSYDKYNTPAAAQCSVLIGDAKINCNTSKYASLTATNTTVMVGGKSISTANGSTPENYLSSGASYSYSWSLKYTDGKIPLNNLGKPDPGYEVKGATKTGTITKTYSGYYPSYYAFTPSLKAVPTAVTATNGNVVIDGVTYIRTLAAKHTDKTKAFTASAKWNQLFYLVPAAHHDNSTTYAKYTKWTGKASTGLDLPVKDR